MRGYRISIIILPNCNNVSLNILTCYLQLKNSLYGGSHFLNPVLLVFVRMITCLRKYFSLASICNLFRRSQFFIASRLEGPSFLLPDQTLHLVWGAIRTPVLFQRNFNSSGLSSNGDSISKCLMSTWNQKKPCMNMCYWLGWCFHCIILKVVSANSCKQVPLYAHSGPTPLSSPKHEACFEFELGRRPVLSTEGVS